MKKNIVNKYSVRKHGYVFDFFVLDTGKIEYCINNGKNFAVKQLANNKAVFIKEQELIIDGAICTLDGIELTDEEFNTLKDMESKSISEKEKLKNPNLNSSSDSPSQIDFWKTKVKTYKDKNKTKQTYCVHNFRIGNDKYIFIERFIPEFGLLINPDYKVDDNLSSVGGVPKKYGELLFWDFFFEDKGWQRIRELTKNEIICLDYIKEHGYFSGNFPKKSKK